MSRATATTAFPHSTTGICITRRPFLPFTSLIMNVLIVITRSLSEVLRCGCALVRPFSQEYHFPSHPVPLQLGHLCCSACYHWNRPTCIQSRDTQLQHTPVVAKSLNAK